MSRVSQRNTAPEKKVLSFLRENKFHFRKNVKTLPGSPDIVLPEVQTIIFIHGCFWHGHKKCKLAKRPSSNKIYWYKKIDENIERDKRKTKELRKLGWRVLTVWQCQIKSKAKSIRRLNSLTNQLQR